MGGDGRTWDLTGMGEGLRNTANLRGRAGAQGFLHWSANFDELQDFEGQIRALAGGTGLMSDADFNTGTRTRRSAHQSRCERGPGRARRLCRLAQYLREQPAAQCRRLAHRRGRRGPRVFRARTAPVPWRGVVHRQRGREPAQRRHAQTVSGTRLGGPLTGIDVPTLRDVWATAPYLHDGSAPTIAAAISAHNGVSLSATDLGNLVAYVEQIGGQESLRRRLTTRPW